MTNISKKLADAVVEALNDGVLAEDIMLALRGTENNLAEFMLKDPQAYEFMAKTPEALH